MATLGNRADPMNYIAHDALYRPVSRPCAFWKGIHWLPVV